MKLWLTPQDLLVCAAVFDPVSLAALHDTGQKIGTNEAHKTAMTIPETFCNHGRCMAGAWRVHGGCMAYEGCSC